MRTALLRSAHGIDYERLTFSDKLTNFLITALQKSAIVVVVVVVVAVDDDADIAVVGAPSPDLLFCVVNGELLPSEEF